MPIYEACVGDLEQAKKAAALGADRIELCADLAEGGITPSLGVIVLAKRVVKIPIHVIIRPRGGDFVYSADELQAMRIDILKCRELGVAGVVFGVLDRGNRIARPEMQELLAAARPMKVTFHMAFDEVAERREAIDILAGLGLERILTRGGAGSAPANLATLRQLVEYAGERLIVMPGGGITRANREQVAAATGAVELHGTRIVGAL
jgi:copper homeostasis protein